MTKILITARNITEEEKETFRILEKAGMQVEICPDAHQYSPEEFIDKLQDVDGVIAGLEDYTREIFDRTPSLKLIVRRGVGVDSIDMEAAKENNVTVTRTEGLVGSGVAELIMAYIIDDARLLSSHNNTMKQGLWSRIMADGVKGKTLGLIGFGGIAQEAAIRANAFGMNVLYYKRNPDVELEKKYQVNYADFDTIIKHSDYISINIPFTSATKNMFHKTVFEQMKSSAILINTARSGIVNVDDLAEALNNNVIRGAYVDVYEYEPCTDSPLLSCKTAVLTPHIGTYTKETMWSMNQRCVEQVLEFFDHVNKA